VRNLKVEHDFIPDGTTQNDIDYHVLKRIGEEFEINGKLSF
jgi:hypothetical protein